MISHAVYKPFMIDLFYEGEDYKVASCVDGVTPYSCATNRPSVTLELQASQPGPLQLKCPFGFQNNYLKLIQVNLMFY